MLNQKNWRRLWGTCSISRTTKKCDCGTGIWPICTNHWRTRRTLCKMLAYIKDRWSSLNRKTKMVHGQDKHRLKGKKNMILILNLFECQLKFMIYLSYLYEITNKIIMLTFFKAWTYNWPTEIFYDKSSCKKTKIHLFIMF